MHIRTVAALAAAITSVHAAGTAYVTNYCNFPAYIWPTDGRRNPKTALTLAPGESYSEPYQVGLPFGGVSIKVSNQSALVPGTYSQFEYTIVNDGAIWYDGSNVDCVFDNCPFWKYGAIVVASDKACRSPECIAGDKNGCPKWYQLWNDDHATCACPKATDITMFLCSSTGEKPASGGNGASGGSGAAAPAVSKVAAPSVPPRQDMDRVVAPSTFQKLPKVTPRAVHIHQRRHGH